MSKKFERSNATRLFGVSGQAHHPSSRLSGVMETIVEGGVWIATSSLPFTLAVASILGR